MEHFEAAARARRPAIFLLWHEDMVGITTFHLRVSRRPVAVMVSRSRDGERLARIIQWLGATPIRASSSRGAVAGLVEMKRWLCAGQGRFAAMAPDGPRGPRRVAKPGVAALARHAGALIVPVAFRHSRQIAFRSWDRTRLPLPFARVTGLFGPPLDPVAGALQNDDGGQALTELLNALHARLDTGD
jgi:hypothetical protein